MNVMGGKMESGLTKKDRPNSDLVQHSEECGYYKCGSCSGSLFSPRTA